MRLGRTAASKPGETEAFLDKALELRATMEQALAERRWNAAGLNGVHAAILAADALASKRRGRHSTGQSHDDALLLLRDLGLPDGPQRADQLQEILSWKHLADYEGRRISEEEARTLAKQVGRFIDWVIATMGKG